MTAAPDGKKRTDSIDQSGFPNLFQAAFANWARGKGVMPEKAFIKAMGLHENKAEPKDVTKTVKNWAEGTSTPKSRSVWNAARSVLLQAPENLSIIDTLDAAYGKARASRRSGGKVPAARWKPSPDEPRPIADRAGVAASTANPPKASLAEGVAAPGAAPGAAIAAPTTRSTTATGSLTERSSHSLYEKLAYISLDPPPQGSEPQRFVLTADIGFGWTPFPDKTVKARVALRRVIILPTPVGCQMIGTSRFGEDGKRPGVKVLAMQWEITAEPEKVLEGPLRLEDGALVTLRGDGSAAETTPSIEVRLQCERETDLKVELAPGPKRRTPSETKIAERFLVKCLAEGQLKANGAAAASDPAVTLATARLAWKRT